MTVEAETRVGADVADLVVHPEFKVPYYTYVLGGLLNRPGIGPLRFRNLGVPEIDGIALEVSGRRVFVSSNDHIDINPAMVDWADCYGKVNLAPETEPFPGLVPLGPIFGIRLWSKPVAYQTAARMIVAGAPALPTVRQVRFQAITKLPMEIYTPSPSGDPDYVFFRSRRWPPKHEEANEPRYRFLDAMKGVDVDFEGGLADDRITLMDYLERTRRSALVFNCPAVHLCLGWKLGEYLALGKAIVSTPISRRLPAPLVHGEHMHKVEDTVEAIREGVETVLSNDRYRRHLEAGARRWYEQNLAPDVLTDRLLAGEWPATADYRGDW